MLDVMLYGLTLPCQLTNLIAVLLKWLYYVVTNCRKHQATYLVNAVTTIVS